MHYVIGDIHNDLKKLKQILKQINITRDDELIVLGDVFDRGGETADPFGVYCALAGLQGKCSWIRGNHDDWLANYTYEYFNTPEKKRHKLAPYGYNSFELLRQRITEVDTSERCGASAARFHKVRSHVLMLSRFATSKSPQSV